jgi:hypothetical protein
MLQEHRLHLSTNSGKLANAKCNLVGKKNEMREIINYGLFFLTAISYVYYVLKANFLMVKLQTKLNIDDKIRINQFAHLKNIVAKSENKAMTGELNKIALYIKISRLIVYIGFSIMVLLLLFGFFR